jgi:hypothetical protein
MGPRMLPKNRMMGLKVSHDQYCCVVSACLLQYCGCPCGNKWAVQYNRSSHRREHNVSSRASSRHAIIGLYNDTIVHSSRRSPWRNTRPIGIVFVDHPARRSVFRIPDHRLLFVLPLLFASLDRLFDSMMQNLYGHSLLFSYGILLHVVEAVSSMWKFSSDQA